MISPITFSTSPAVTPQLLQEDLKRQKIQRLVLSILTCGIYLLGSALMSGLKRKLVPLAYMPSISMPKLRCNHPELRSVSVETLDHTKLDAREWLAPSSSKWMIFFCPNGMPYEDLVEEKLELAKRLNVNILFFNYRNVGFSEGKLNYGRHLLLDGSAVVDYLKIHKGVQENDITFWGHSMGGGVAAALAKYYPQVKVINDRSYSKLSHVAPIYLPFIKITGLELNAITPWMQIPEDQKMIVFHRQDGIIPYKRASLYHAAKAKLKELHPEATIKKSTQGKTFEGLADHLKPNRIKLKSFGGRESHMYPICMTNEFLLKAYQLIWGTPLIVV